MAVPTTPDQSDRTRCHDDDSNLGGHEARNGEPETGEAAAALRPGGRASK